MLLWMVLSLLGLAILAGFILLGWELMIGEEHDRAALEEPQTLDVQNHIGDRLRSIEFERRWHRTIGR